MKVREGLISALIFLLSSLIAAGVGEAVLRIRNGAMNNYDIEMWRYAKALKVRSADPIMDFDHVRNGSAVLESVTIRTNAWGLRGGPVGSPKPGVRRILFLGGSITLGWGVKEEATLTQQLRQMFAARGQTVEVLNGGVGNYNTQRAVERFFVDLQGLAPTDIVVQYFLRDAEQLERGRGNPLLRNSELAASLWMAADRLTSRSGEAALEDHYQDVYRAGSPGRQAMLAALKRLADYARARHIRLYLAMTPDIHNLQNYPFGYIHQLMRQTAEADGYRFVDLLPAFQDLSPAQVWAMPGDPHPNALGHRRMAEALFPVLAEGSPSAGAPSPR